jgi:hypothetical protein
MIVMMLNKLKPIFRAGFLPWVYFSATIALWVTSAFLLATTPTDIALRPGLLEGAIFLFFLLGLSEHFWRRYLLRPFLNEHWWLQSWIYWALAAVCLALAFRFAVYDMETNQPGVPVVALLHPVNFAVSFFLGGWGLDAVAFRILFLLSLSFAAWGCHVNHQAKRNFYMEQIRSVMQSKAEEKMRKDIAKRSFGPHRNLFDDN